MCHQAKYAGLELAHKSQRRKALGLTSLAFEKFVVKKKLQKKVCVPLIVL